MVWTSDYPEGRPGYGSKSKSSSGKSESGSGSTGNSDSGASKSSAAVAPKPDSSSSESTNKYGFSSKAGTTSSSGSGSSSSSTSNSGKRKFASSGSQSDPHNKPNVNPISGGSKKQGANKRPPSKPGPFLLIGGVILPVAAIVFELTTHMCAKSFFDPLPTPAHVLLFALIPISNLLVWVASRRNMTDMLGMLTLGTGMAMGVAILYSLMFLPLVPLSVVAILFFGFGLLALSPLLAIPAVWKSSKYAIHLSKTNKTYFDGHQLEHIGHMIILCTVVAVELPSTMTRMHIGEAVHSENSVEAIEWLRQWGSQEVMLRACYERSGRATDILGSLYEVKNPTSVEDARRIFYQVTGKPFNSVPLPAALRATRANQGLLSDHENEEPNVEDEFDRDPDIAGEAVSGVARGLTMTESKLSGFVDGVACYANLTWNVTFGNSSPYDREVRSKILLPPGAFVTNAFLIVDGTEREATVMGRSMARRKYRAAVADKKDPLLVSTCGADTVLLQLYPVSPQSKIGVRLNIISPLAVPDMSLASLTLPTFEERNFQVDVSTTVKLKSQQMLRLSTKALNAERSVTGFDVEDSLTTPDLARFASVVTVQRDRKISQIQGTHDGFLIGENIKQINYPQPENVSVVIDGSNGMAPHFSSVLKILERIPAEIPVKIVYVRDGKMDHEVVATSDREKRVELLEKIAKIPCAGGQLNLNPLTSELNAAISSSNTAVLWIHAAQPIPGKLNRALDLNLRRMKKPLLYDFAVAAGPNEILSGAYSCPGLIRVDRGGSVEADLLRLFTVWRMSGPYTEVGGIEYVRKDLTKEYAQSTSLKPADKAIAQLVAFDEVSKLAVAHANHKCKYARQGVRISNEYHLVTPFSSAIITEPIPRPSNPVSILAPSEDKPSLLGSLRPSTMIGKIPLPMMSKMQTSEEVRSARMLEDEKQAKKSDAGEYQARSAGSVGGPYNYAPRQYQSLDGATNGTVFGSAAGGGGNPMLGDQFSSAANTGAQSVSSEPINNEAATQNFAMQEQARQDAAQSIPSAPPVASFRPGAKSLMDGNAPSVSGELLAKAKEVDAVDYAPRRRAQMSSAEPAAKDEVAERKQLAYKSNRDEEFGDDEEGGYDSGEEQQVMEAPADKNMAAFSPVTPESDTYLLLGVGMLILGFALQSQRKVKAKKA